MEGLVTDGITDKNKKQTKELLNGQKLLLRKGMTALLRKPHTSNWLDISWRALFTGCLDIFNQSHLFAHKLQLYIHKLCFLKVPFRGYLEHLCLSVFPIYQ